MVVITEKDSLDWQHLIDKQLRPEHASARVIAAQLRDIGVSCAKFSSAAILVFRATQWRNKLAELPADFSDTVLTVQSTLGCSMDTAYVWSIIGASDGLPVETVIEFAREKSLCDEVVRLMLQRGFTATVVRAILNEDIDEDLIDHLIAYA